jgi:hypothetical protein
MRWVRMIVMCAAFGIALAAIALAVASFLTSGRWRIYGGEHRAYFAMSRDGSLRLWSQELWITPATPPGWRIDVRNPDTVNLVTPIGIEYPMHTKFVDLDVFHEFLGLGWADYPLARGGTWDIDGGKYRGDGRMISVKAPWVLIAPMACLPAVVMIVRGRRRMKRVIAGKCLNCGYDLRATPERCPECGSVSAESSRATPSPAARPALQPERQE